MALSELGEADPSESLVSSASSCQRTPIYKPFTQCRHPMDCSPHPAPHNISEEELHFVKTCLQRWRTEVENDINGETHTQISLDCHEWQQFTLKTLCDVLLNTKKKLYINPLNVTNSADSRWKVRV